MLKSKSAVAAHQKRLEALRALNHDIQIFALLSENLNQASIWTYNSMGMSDALLDRNANAALIKSLEEASNKVDGLLEEAKAKSKALRDQLRPLMKEIKSPDELKTVTTLVPTVVPEEPQPAKPVKQQTKSELITATRAELAAKQTTTAKAVKSEAKPKAKAKAAK